jgi:hypothetical protein
MSGSFDDLWPEGDASAEQRRKRKARIAWPFMIATHDWMHRAIYVYHLEKEEMKVVRRPTPEQWERYTTVGVQIPYPCSIHAGDLAARVKYGREQARQLGIPPEHTE